jgi:hypothetical protein
MTDFFASCRKPLAARTHRRTDRVAMPLRQKKGLDAVDRQAKDEAHALKRSLK